MLSAQMLADLSAPVIPNNPYEFTDVNGTLFFATDHDLWKSDGTSTGTVRVKPLGSSSPKELIEYNGILYFTVNWEELWKSDGTEAGTVLVRAFPRPANIEHNTLLAPTICNDTLFFAADDGVHGLELWKSDGSPGGTMMVKDINEGPEFFHTWAPGNLTNVNGQLFFSASDGITGRELWKSDGTSAGTQIVKNINPNPGSDSNPNCFVNFNGTLLFAADDGVNGRELWKSDGTAAGTVLVKDIAPGSFSSQITATMVCNGKVFFARSSDYYPDTCELWTSDGTSAGTAQISNALWGGSLFSYGRDLVAAVGGEMFFATKQGELWKTDGTVAGTIRVKQGLGAYLLTASGNLLYFTSGGLWRSDGTPGGTFQVWDGDVSRVQSGSSLTPWKGGVVFLSQGMPWWDVGNVRPSADAGQPLWVAEGGSVTLSGSGTAPAGATITAYEWDFNYDWKTFKTQATGAHPTFSAATIDGPAVRTVALRVTDSSDEVSPIATTTITITNAAPQANFASERIVGEGQDGSLTFSNPIDSPGDIAAGFKYSFDFNNDGTFEVANSLSASAVVPASFLVLGPNSVRGRIADKDGGYKDYTTQVLVQPEPTANAGGPYIVGEGLSIALAGTGVPAAGQSIAAYEWDLDYDGSTFHTTATGVSSTFSAASIDGPATRTVALRVRDNAGVYSDIATATLSIANVAPTATVTANTTIAAGQSAYFSFSAQKDSPADLAAGFKYSFDFNNDGTFEMVDGVAPTAIFGASYLPVGSHTIRGRIADKDGGYSDYTAQVVVRPRVIANANGPYTVSEGATLSLAGTASVADGQTISAYEWDLNYSGTTFDVDATGAAPVFSAAAIDGPATRTVALRVRDDLNLPSEVATATVNIINVAPTATFSNSGSMYVGQNATVGFTAPSDASAADRAGGFKYSYDLNNDGAFDILNSAGASAIVQASYLSVGSNTIRGRIADKDGGFTDYTTQITVRAKPLANAGGPYSVAEGASISLSGSGTSPDGQAIVGYEWDLDYDGTSFQVDAAGASPTFSAAAIDGPGTRTIAFRVRDNAGAYSGIVIATVTVTNVAPTAQIEPVPTAAFAGDGVSAFGSWSDPCPADAATMSWSVTDGTGQVVATASGPNLSFTPASAGSYRLTLSVTDDDGALATTSVDVVVSWPPISISGSVFNDANGDGVRNAWEKTIGGQSLYLDIDEDGVQDATEPLATTDASGIYRFEGLSPKSYRVRPAMPIGWRLSTTAIGYQAGGLGAGKDFSVGDIPLTQTVRVEGSVFLDANGNRKRDAREKGKKAVRVFLDRNNNGKLDKGELSARTDALGLFTFAAAPAGRYTLRALLSNGYTQTAPKKPFALKLSPGQVIVGRAMGIRKG